MVERTKNLFPSSGKITPQQCAMWYVFFVGLSSRVVLDCGFGSTLGIEVVVVKYPDPTKEIISRHQSL